MLNPFSLAFSQDQAEIIASSMTFEESNWFPWKMRLFLWCQIVLVRATHHPYHLLWFTLALNPSQNCVRWLAGAVGSGPTTCSHDMDSHHRGSVLWQLKNRWPTYSWTWPHKGQSASWIMIFLLRRLPLVGNLSLRSLQVKVAALGGMFIFHINLKILTSEAEALIFNIILYAELVEYTPVDSAFHTIVSFTFLWIKIEEISSIKFTANILSWSNKFLLQLRSHLQPSSEKFHKSYFGGYLILTLVLVICFS